jgi:inorganic pyrophosphatase
MKFFAPVLVLLLASATGVVGQTAWPKAEPGPVGHPYDEAQPAVAPQELLVVIEIPAESSIKYEIDKATGRLYVDRFQSMPVATPANYGSIPRSLGPDGDPLDVVVLARFPLHPGAFIRVRPVGVLKTMDGGHLDEKVLAVPVSAVDPTYDGITDVSGIPAAERERIAAYFRVYKQLPPGGQEGRTLEFGDARAAREAITQAFARFRQVRSKPSAQ